MLRTPTRLHANTPFTSRHICLSAWYYLLHRPNAHNVLLGIKEIGNKAHITRDFLLRTSHHARISTLDLFAECEEFMT